MDHLLDQTLETHGPTVQEASRLNEMECQNIENEISNTPAHLCSKRLKKLKSQSSATTEISDEVSEPAEKSKISNHNSLAISYDRAPSTQLLMAKKGDQKGDVFAIKTKVGFLEYFLRSFYTIQSDFV